MTCVVTPVALAMALKVSWISALRVASLIPVSVMSSCE